MGDSAASPAAVAAAVCVSLREQMAKLPLQQQSLSAKLHSITGLVTRAMATAAAADSVSPATASYTRALVHSVAALAEEWVNTSSSPALASFPGASALQDLCARGMLSVLIAAPAGSAPTPAQQAFAAHYSVAHMRQLLPISPWHRDETRALPALRLFSHVLTGLQPLLPVSEWTARAELMHDATRFLLVDVPDQSLVPLLLVQMALVQLWITHPATCPHLDQCRYDTAVRWLSLLPSAPQRADAQRVRAAKDLFIRFISAPWQEAPPSAPVLSPSSTGGLDADRQIVETLETVFLLLMGAPLVAFKAGQPQPLPSIYLADLVRTIPLHYASVVPAQVAKYAGRLKPAALQSAAIAAPSSPNSASFATAAAASSSAFVMPTESNLVAALLSMLDWGLDARIEPWASALLDGVLQANKTPLLRDVAQRHLADAVGPQLLQRATREGAFKLLRKMLLWDQSSPAAFLSCVDGFVRACEALCAELSSSDAASSTPPPSPAFLRSFSLLLRALMYHFTGHAEYLPLASALKALETAAAAKVQSGASAFESIEPTEKDMQDELKAGAWKPPPTPDLALMSSASSTASAGSLESVLASVLATARPPRAREPGGKTGLENLGNSCYMNSVLQSLCLTDSFRRTLVQLDRARLGYSFLRMHPILLNLSSVFGFLHSSSRPAYAPSVLYKALPAHFRDMSQQDAGEFAKYVLDVVAASLKKKDEMQQQKLTQQLTASTNAAVPTAASTTSASATAASSPSASVISNAVASTSSSVTLSSPSTAAPMDIVPSSVSADVRGGDGSPAASKAPAAVVATLVDPASTGADANATSSVMLVPSTTHAPSPASETSAAPLSPAAASAVAAAAADPVVSPAPSSAPSSSTVDIIQDAFFGGQLLSELTCETCGTTSSKVEPFVELPLSLEIEEVPPTAAATAPAPTKADAAATGAADAPAEPLKAVSSADRSEMAHVITEQLSRSKQWSLASKDKGGAAGTKKDQFAAEIGDLVSSYLCEDDDTAGEAGMVKEELDFMMRDAAPEPPADAVSPVPLQQPSVTPAPSSAAADASVLAASVMLTMASQAVVAAAVAAAAASMPSAAPAPNGAAAVTASPPTGSVDGISAAGVSDGGSAASNATVPTVSSANSTSAGVPAPSADPVSAVVASQPQPAPAPAAPRAPASTSVVPSGPLHLSALLSHYFRPELLQGENAYMCSRCREKRSARKSLAVLSPPPEHLLLCLKRNQYLLEGGRVVRNKIMKEVLYPCVIKLPVLKQQQHEAVSSVSGGVSSASSESSTAPSRRTTEYQLYVLYSVIIHSGTRTQNGHYYTIGRHSDDDALDRVRSLVHARTREAQEEDRLSAEVSPEIEKEARGGSWFQFNDSSVSPSSFEALENLTGTLPSDVAYLLFYRSLASIQEGKSHANEEGAAKSAAASRNALDSNLLGAVQRDNVAFLAEVATAARIAAQRSALEKNYASARTTSAGASTTLPEEDSDPDMR